jgi:hypothetical protein
MRPIKPAEDLPIYRDDGRILFCRLCQCSFVPSRPNADDPRGVRMHERDNPHRHGKWRTMEPCP